MITYLLDSDILIWHLRGRPEVSKLLERLAARGELGVSAVSVLEMQAGVKPGEQERTNTFLEGLTHFPVDRAIASLAGEYIRTYEAKGVNLDFADSVVAATAVMHDLTLVTKNVSRYPMPAARVIMPYLAYEHGKTSLLPSYFDELVPDDHIVRVISEVVDLLDISPLTFRTKIENWSPYHLRMMAKVLFYAYSQHASSSAEIARRCAEDLMFIWLTGAQRLDTRAISSFRKDNVEPLAILFRRIVQVCQKIGILSHDAPLFVGLTEESEVDEASGRKDLIEEAGKAIIDGVDTIEKYLANSIAVDEAEAVLRGDVKTGHDLAKRVKKVLEKRETLMAAVRRTEGT